MGPPSLHYCCAVVLRSSIVLSSVRHSSNHEYHCCPLTGQSSSVSNFYHTFKVFIWLTFVSLSLPLNKGFDPTPCWWFLTPRLSVCRCLLWSTSSNVTYTAAMGYQSTTSYEQAYRIGVMFILCLYSNDYMAKNCTSLLHTYYHINIQHIIRGADVINPNMDFSWTECLYADGIEIKCAVLRRCVIMACS